MPMPCHVISSHLISSLLEFESDGYSEYDDSDDCAIVGNDWLGLISSWVYYNMDSSRYDNVQFITDIKFNWNSCNSQWGGTYVCSRTLGWGNIGVVCKGSSSVSTNSVVEEFGGNENAVGTIAHELGMFPPLHSIFDDVD